MYDPKDILTEDGYEDYKMHLRNIEKGLFFLENHVDDLHIGALDAKQDELFWKMIQCFAKLKPVLLKGDGEKDDE
jgi:hypothetical protein